MKTWLNTLVAASMWLCLTGAARSAVTVEFVNPDNFTDMPRLNHEQQQVLQELERHFAHLAARLPAGHDLKVQVLDIDLAGRIEPLFAGQRDVRVLKGQADWPSMELRYRIEAGGQLVRAGQAHVADMNYQGHLSHYGGSEFLRHEKQMLDDWWSALLKEPANPAKP